MSQEKLSSWRLRVPNVAEYIKLGEINHFYET